MPTYQHTTLSAHDRHEHHEDVSRYTRDPCLLPDCTAYLLTCSTYYLGRLRLYTELWRFL